MKNLIAAAAVLALSCLPSAAFDAAQVRLTRAQDASAAAVGAGSAEQSSALSLKALEGGSLSGPSSVDARGSVRSDAATQNLTFSPKKTAALSVPPPAKASSLKSADDDHAGLFILGGLAAPAVGAIAGALIGGVPGAIGGAVAGLCVGLVLFAIGVCRALRHIFNP